jgi:hypothetical protein
MQLTPNTIVGLALFVFALAFMPRKYHPAWIYRLRWWQMLIGLVATVAALLIVMNPEFLALGILGDSAFFDLLALAIGIQLQVILSRIGAGVVAGNIKVLRLIGWRICVLCSLLALMMDAIASTIQRVMHRFIS